VVIATEFDPLDSTEVDGYHGRAKPFCENRLSKNTFRVTAPMFLIRFWMRPPTIASVLI
jgi:hypothetical protein